MSKVCKTYMLSAIEEVRKTIPKLSTDDETSFYLSQGLDVIKNVVSYVYSEELYQYTPSLLPVPIKLKQACGILQDEIITVNWAYNRTHFQNRREFFALCERIHVLLEHIINGYELIIRPLEDK